MQSSLLLVSTMFQSVLKWEASPSGVAISCSLEDIDRGIEYARSGNSGRYPIRT